MLSHETRERAGMAAAARAGMAGRMRVKHKHGLASLGALICFLGLGAPANAQMERLIGGSLTWSVNPAFLDNQASRTVTFNLRTSWAVADGAPRVASCSALKKSEEVSCSMPELMADALGVTQCNPELGGEGCGVAERFGVLCVAQLVRSGSTYYALYSDDNAQCVSEANAHLSRKYEAGIYGTAGENRPALRAGSALSEVGIPNQFVVQQIYDAAPSEEEEASSVARKPGPAVVVTGVLTHTIKVDENAEAVVAWLAPRSGFANFEQKTGLLLPGCTEVSGQACMYNECSLQRMLVGSGPEFMGAAFRVQGTDYTQADAFWDGFEGSGCGSGKSCLQRGSPALETYVPLCSYRVGSGRGCTTEGVNNYYSPVSAVPDMVEVAVTAIARLPVQASPWTYRGYNPYQDAAVNFYKAPHQVQKLTRVRTRAHAHARTHARTPRDRRQQSNVQTAARQPRIR